MDEDIHVFVFFLLKNIFFFSDMFIKIHDFFSSFIGKVLIKWLELHLFPIVIELQLRIHI